MDRKEKKKKTIDPYDVLAERVPVTAHDLVRMIHRINPTSEWVDTKEASERYRLKAGLQSLLIRRFSQGLLVEPPDADQPNLIGIRLRHFDEDACHAMIHELDEDVRSWVRLQIDQKQTDRLAEATSFREVPAQNFSGLRAEADPSEANLPVQELVMRGRKALEEYDYERSEALYRRALEVSQGCLVEAALGLLEIFVQHLAAYEEALALVQSLPPSTMKDKGVRIGVAVACARLGQIKNALEWINGVLEPEAAEVYFLAATRLLQEDEERQALHALSALKSCGSKEFLLKTGGLEKEILALQARRLAPLEEEMVRCWEEGEEERASTLADRLLSLIPENKAARRIVSERERKERRRKIEHLLELEEEVRLRQDFCKELDLLNQVMALGEETPSLRQRFEEAQEQVRRQREEREVDAAASLWSQGHRERSLIAYVTLQPKLRQKVRERTGDPHFTWIEQALGATMTLKPKKLAEAVLALGQSREALETGADPRQILAQLQPYQRMLQALPQAQDVLMAVEKRIRDMGEARARTLLDEAWLFIGAKDLEKAGERINRLKSARLEKGDRLRFEEITARFNRLREMERLAQKYAESTTRGDHVTSRRIADHLASSAEEGNGRPWQDRAAEHAEAIKKDWHLVAADLDGLPGCYGPLGLDTASERENCLLLPDGRHLLVADARARWVFFKVFSLEDQRFEKCYVFRIPRSLDSLTLTAEGNSVWINDSDGSAVQVGLDPFDILSWHDFSAFIGQEEVCEDAILYPKRRRLWLNKRSRKKGLEEIFEIFHMDQGRSVRRFRSAGLATRINTGAEFRTALPDILTNTVRICSETGKVLETITLEAGGNTNVGAIHPNGVDYVFLPYISSNAADPFVDRDREEDYALTLEVKPDSEKRNKPIRMAQTDGEAPHAIATSLEAGLLFTFFCDISSAAQEYRLASWRPTAHGLEMVYRVPATGNFIFASDEFARKVAAVVYSKTRLEAFVLDERPPRLDPSPSEFDDNLGIPSFHYPWMCSYMTGASNAQSLAIMMQLKHSDYLERLRIIQEKKQSPASVDEIAALLSALERMFLLEEAQDLRMWMRQKYPDYHRVKMDLAEEAAKLSDWPRAISMIEGISRHDLDDGTGRHLCHLLGMGYFAKGAVDKAMSTWEEGLAYENGRCELEPYIHYAKISLMSAKWRRRHRDRSRIARTLSILESVDTCLARKEWMPAITLIETEYPLKRADLQILARLAEAYLHMDYGVGEMRWVCKAVALALYLECVSGPFLRNLLLPPCVETWSESRLAEVARRSGDWLDNTAPGRE